MGKTGGICIQNDVPHAMVPERPEGREQQRPPKTTPPILGPDKHAAHTPSILALN